MAVVAAAAVMEVVNEVSRCRCRLMSMMNDECSSRRAVCGGGGWRGSEMTSLMFPPK